MLVCPFDSLLWDRPLLERAFGFRHVIEVYKREHERVEGALRVRRFTREPTVRGNVSEKLERAAHRLAWTIGLEGVRLD